MSSQLGQHQKAICFQLLTEENKGGKARQSKPEGGVDKQWSTAHRIILLTCGTTQYNQVDLRTEFILPGHNLMISNSNLIFDISNVLGE